MYSNLRRIVLKRNSIQIIIYIILWYGFSVVSAIFTKIYLNNSNNPFTFTVITFCYGFILKFLKEPDRIVNLLDDRVMLKNYVYLSVLNIGGLLLTNISINQFSISLVYMVKSCEPIFVLLLSNRILGHSYNIKIIITLIQVSFGVSLTIIGYHFDNSFDSMLGFIYIFFSNLSTASRSVFFKLLFQLSDNNQTNQIPLLSFYININFLSFIIIIPFYLVKFFFDVKINSQTDSYYIRYLLIASFLNFLYNLFSFKILENISSITHSIINIMKRMFVVFGSILYFSTKLTTTQYIGMFLADSGCLIYSYFKSTNPQTVTVVSNYTKKKLKQSIFIIISCVLVFSTFADFKNFGQANNKNLFISEIHENYNVSYNNNSENYTKLSYYNRNRIKCLKKIRKHIIESFKDIIPKQKHAVLLDVPNHINYGDTLIWLDFL